MARRRKPEPPAPDGSIPDELLSRLHPVWKDPDAVRAAFPGYVRPGDFAPLSFRRLYATLLNRWAIANGYESEEYPGHMDLRRLRAAGLYGPPDRPGDTREESRLRRVAWLDEMAGRNG